MDSKTEKILAFIEERIKWNVDMMKRDTKPSDIGRIEEAKCIRRFIDSLQEEPVSEDLEDAATKYGTDEFPSLCGGCKHVPVDAFKAGAKWQKSKDQETIELAEDHAMLAGMEKMREQMMANAVEGNVLSCEGLSFPVSNEIHRFGLEEGDKVKVIILKDE